MKLVMLLTFLINVNSVYAQDVIRLEQNTPAPYTGILFPEAKAIEIKNQLIEKDYQDIIIKSQARSLDLFKSNEEYYNKQKDILDLQNDKLAKELYEARQTSHWEILGWFGLGVVTTSLAVFGVKQITK